MSDTSRVEVQIQEPAVCDWFDNLHQSKVGFDLRDDGLYYGEKHDGEIRDYRVCGRIEVIAMTQDEAGNWGQLIRFDNPDKVAVERIVPLRLFERDGTELRELLRDAGLVIEPTSEAKKRVALYLQTNMPSARARIVNRIGWHADVFVLPDVTFGSTKEKLICQVGAHSYAESGSLDEWRNHIGRYCIGNSRLAVAVSAAFAGPVLRRVGAESGGVHFRGLSSGGKTTALEAAGSVWGGSSEGYVRTWRTTSNGLEATAVLHNDGLLCLDEMSQVSPKEVGDIAYMLANGKGKGRMNRDATAKDSLSWALMFISSGEVSLEDHMRESGKKVRGGQQNRLIDISADAGAGHGIFEHLHEFRDGAVLADQLKHASKQFYGSPIRAFLQHLVEDKPDLAEAIKVSRAALTPGECQFNGGEIQRVANRFALIAAAGELATSAGITGWRPGEATSGAKCCLKAWVRERGHGPADAQAAISQVRLFILQHEGRFATVDQYGSSSTENRVGFRRDVNGATEYCCFNETFKSVLCSGYNPGMVARALKDQGLLLTDGDRLSVKRTIPGTKNNPRVFAIRGAILEGDPDPP